MQNKKWYKQSEAAEILGVTPQYISKLAREKKIKKNSRSMVDINELRAYITNQDGIEQGASNVDEIGITSEPSNYAEAKAYKEYMLGKKIEFELDVLKGKYHHLDDITADAELIATAVREKMYSIPNSFGHYLVHLGLKKRDITAIIKELKDMITEALKELQRGKFAKNKR
jgi:predicted transcriptional regulator